MELDELEALLINLKKSKGRFYSTSFVQEKRELISRGKNSLEEVKDARIQKRFVELKDSIEKRLVLQGLKMAKFDLSSAVRILPDFEGDHRELSKFLGLIDFYAETLESDQERAALVKFILTAKLSDRVKNRLIAEQTPLTISQFKETLLKTYIPETPND